MSNIRVTYSGLISLAIRFLSLFTGLAFTLIVTRQLSEEEFGTWGLISAIIVYATIINPIINYWSTREIARGQESGKTAFVSNGIFSAGGMFVYIIIAFFVGLQSDAKLEILMLATILIPVLFINNSLNAINAGWKPHVVSYGFFTFELIKIPAGLVLVYFLQLGVEGAIYAVFLGYLASIGIQIFFGKENSSINAFPPLCRTRFISFIDSRTSGTFRIPNEIVTASYILFSLGILTASPNCRLIRLERFSF